MTKVQPLLSIVIPTYNRCDHLKKNLGFQLEEFAKTPLTFEVFIVDNASTDDTQEYIKSLNNPHIRYVRRTQNFGPEDNGMYASRHAHGKYVVFVGDDDRLIPEKVAQYVSFLEQNPQYGMLQAPWYVSNDILNPKDAVATYKVDFDCEIKQNRHDLAIRLILEKGVYPEFSITRKDIIENCYSKFHPHAFWSYVNLTRVLTKTNVVFVNEPYVYVSGLGGDITAHHGGRDVLSMWDRYKGGLEYMLNFAIHSGQMNAFELQIVLTRMDALIAERIKTAANFNLKLKNWANAYYLQKRVLRHYPDLANDEINANTNALAAIETAIDEASTFSAQPIILDDLISDDVLDLMHERIKQQVVRLKDIPEQDLQTQPFAFITSSDHFPPSHKETDGIYDLRGFMVQFV